MKWFERSGAISPPLLGVPLFRLTLLIVMAAGISGCGARTGIYDPDASVTSPPPPPPPAAPPDAGGCFLPTGEPIVFSDWHDRGDSVYRILPDPASAGFVIAGEGAFEPVECQEREDPAEPPPPAYIGFVAADRRIERVWRFTGAVIEPTNVFIARDRDEVVAVIQTYVDFELGSIVLEEAGFAVAWFGPHGDMRSTGVIDDPEGVPRFMWAASEPLAGAVPVAHNCKPETRALGELVCPVEGVAVSLLSREGLVWSVPFALETEYAGDFLQPRGLVTVGSTVIAVIFHSAAIVVDGTVIPLAGVDYSGIREYATSFIALDTHAGTVRHLGTLVTEVFDSIYDRVTFVVDGRRAYFGVVVGIVDGPEIVRRQLHMGVVDLDAGTVELEAPRPSFTEESVLDLFLDGPTRYVSICTHVRGPARILIDGPRRSVEHRIESGCVSELRRDAADRILIGGWFEGMIDIPGVRAESAMSNDGFVAFLP